MSQVTQENDVIFIDTIESVASASGVIKLNLVRAVEPTEEGEEPQIVPAGRLVMPLPGFIYAVSVIEGFLNKEEVRKLIKAYQELEMLPGDDTGQAVAGAGATH